MIGLESAERLEPGWYPIECPISIPSEEYGLLLSEVVVHPGSHPSSGLNGRLLYDTDI